MYDLPLFPLNTVLFPGTPINLHIFEKRYLDMIGLCLERHQPFGVVLIREGVEAFGPLAEPYRMGCTAEIIKLEELPEGRKNIVAVGQERFRILSLDQKSKSYLMGRVEDNPLKSADEAEMQAAGAELRLWFDRYLKAMSLVVPAVMQIDQLGGDPISLAYLAAALLQVPSEQKQALLEMDHALDLLSALRTIYRREVALVRATRGLAPGKGAEPFSRN